MERIVKDRLTWGLPVKRKQTDDPRNRITIHESGELVYLTFPVLEKLEGIVHGFSTRLGGVSQGEVGSLNLSYGREESRKNVRENHRRLSAAIGYDPRKMVWSAQTHTTNVRVVGRQDCGLGFDRELPYGDVDGLVTNEPGIPLMTFYADCVPLLLVDPVHRAIGCSHSGWRGTVGNMGRATLKVMAGEYGTDPRDVVAAIGPSICQDCYEVSEDVIEQFRDAYRREDWPSLFYEKENGKYQLNLQQACRLNFLQAGVPDAQISVPDLCTCCNPDLLYSHRASHGRRGNLAAVLMLR